MFRGFSVDVKRSFYNVCCYYDCNAAHGAEPAAGGGPRKISRKPCPGRGRDALDRAGRPRKGRQDALACDGLLLPGGGDIDPKFYGQERIPACGEPNVLRDTAEPLLLRAFLAADKPVLAICRGIQLMNVALGGDLYQDIKPFEHVPHNDHWGKIHTVTVRRDTLLSRILGQDTVLVNSQHHQAVDKVAQGLVLSALSEDGIVEGIEKPDAKFCLGVQWHPEWLSAADPAMQGIFDAFVAACK